ncbi:uncharacterized protein [Mytilus edulis]|uniref:uncharacterized protein n=1 Tax=Mytilus edulis TaxID=6550 RepID=UPI0039F0A16F
MASWDEKLLRAAGNGNIKEVEICVRNGANLEYTDLINEFGRTPLLFAAEKGHLEVITYLVTQGSKLEARDCNENTPLILAAEEGHLEVVTYLVTKGSKLEASDVDGETALHNAAWNGDIDITKLLTEKGCSPWVKSNMDKTPYDMVSIHNNDSEERKKKKKEVMDFLETAMSKTSPEVFPDTAAPEVKDSIPIKQNSAMLNRLLGEGSYESFDMRCMVTGQFAVGKTSLVKLLAGDVIPEGRHPTDGISLVEGRCGLDIKTRSWILINPETYNAMDVVYNKVLMTSVEEEETNSNEKLDQQQSSYTSPIGSTDDNMGNPGVPLQQSQAIALPVQLNTADNLYNQQTAALSLSSQASSIVSLSRQQLKQKMKAKMTKDEIRMKMEKVLKSGKYKMKVGRLIFWDFGGQYVYYTTHQTFMTFRALFLVVFDGSEGLHKQVPDVLCFPGQHMTPTPAVFLQHWVNCILTYCKAVFTGIPKILFVATHKDKVPKEVIETQRELVFSGVEELFKDHEGRHHLVLDKQIFVNATDEFDPEIEVLKTTITDLTFDHPCWGERMPNAFVPLELEIAELVAEGKQILSLAEVEELNAISKVSVLSFDQLREFLQFHHSLGKIVYFDIPQLRDYVVISPLLLVEVMRSFVTDKGFWPKKGDIRKTFERMSVRGIIQRKDLYLIWEQKHFDKLLPYKEFIFDMLIHLDILSEHRRYDMKTGSRLPVENFFVPCMLTERNNTGFMAQECTPEKAISLAFVFKGTIIPPALPNRLISACLSMWTVKSYEGRKLLFSGFIGLSFDKVHDIVVCVEGNRILLYIAHKTSNGLIVPDIATGIKESMFTTLVRISEFYQTTVHATSSSQKLPFHIEYACSWLECYITEEAALANDEWTCDKHKIVHTKYQWNVWNQDQTKEQCEVNCPGLQEGALNQTPSDIELQRFSSRCDETTIRELSIHLGMSFQEWEELRSNYYRVEVVKYRILINWREKCSGKFSNIAKALTDMHLPTHTLCQIRRIRKGQNDIHEIYMELIPTDEILDALAQVIGVVSFQLGIELELPITSIDIIQHDNGRNLVAQCKDILFQWRMKGVRPTIRVLVEALLNVGRGTKCLEEIIKTVGVKTYILQEEITEEQEVQIKLIPQDLEEVTEEKGARVKFLPREEVTEEKEEQTKFLPEDEVTEEKGAKLKFLKQKEVKAKKEGKVKTFLKKLNPFQKKK